MSKQNAKPKTLAEAAKVIGYHCKEVEEMARDVGRKIAQDQAKWLDDQMKDLLPPALYEAAHRGELEQTLAGYFEKHGISLVFIPDRRALRIMLHGKPWREFSPKFTIDGEPVKIEVQSFMGNGAQN